ncbi:MAG: hypothetical protein mread185_000437 [Mycoplasmataceae bacterium]|nr:MAG: hypothetical protein mread185_000437 [Mycoplasmataceae bacterium]
MGNSKITIEERIVLSRSIAEKMLIRLSKSF